MKQIILILLTVLHMSAAPIDQLRIVDVSADETISICSKLAGTEIDIAGDLPRHRLSLNIRKPIAQEDALEFLIQLLRVNGVEIKKRTDGGLSATSSPIELYTLNPAQGLKERLGETYWNELERRKGAIGHIELKNESPITVISLIEKITGKTAIRSALITKGSVNYIADNISPLELIKALDLELTKQSIYLIAAQNDSLIFLKRIEPTSRADQ